MFNKDIHWYLYTNRKENWIWKSIKLHRIIATTFLHKSHDSLQVNHKDWNKLNNKLSNLERITASENILHTYKVLWRKVPESCWRHLIDKQREYISKRKIWPWYGTSKKIYIDWDIYHSVTIAANIIWCTAPLISMAANWRIFKRWILANKVIYFI